MPAFWEYPLPPHDNPYYSYQIPSQTRQSQSYKFEKIAETSNFSILHNNFTNDTHSEVAW